VTEVQVKQQIIGDWKELMGLFYLFIGIMVVFAFTMAFIVVFNTLTTNVIEREREIATMRTIGEDQRRIALMITLENIITGIIAVPFGLVFGVLAASAMVKTFENEMLAMKLIIYPQTYLIVFALVFVAMLASEIPAIRRMSRINLAEAAKTAE
jgi:putative ABC transport system permease protein